MNEVGVPECALCTEDVYSYYDLLEHISRRHGRNSKPARSFHAFAAMIGLAAEYDSSITEADRHAAERALQRNAIPQDGYACASCDETLGDAHALARHFFLEHEGEVELLSAQSVRQYLIARVPTEERPPAQRQPPPGDSPGERVKASDSEHHRQRLTERIVLDFIHQFALTYHRDEHGVLRVRLPLDPKRLELVEWDVAFDRKTAEARVVEALNFTNPKFQRILAAIGSDPVLAVWLARKPGAATTPSPVHQLLRADFSFHVKFRTYGDAREELFSVSLGEADLGEYVVTDAFEPDAVRLPPQLGSRYEEAKRALEQHLERRVRQFAHHARKRRIEEEESLDKLSQQSYGYGWNSSRQIDEDDEFYRAAISRYRKGLDEKYQVSVEARLLSVEPYLLVGDAG